MGILFLVVIGYLFVGFVLLWVVKTLTGSKKAVWVVAVLLLVGPFWHPLFCSLLFKIIVREPLQEIHQTVEAPESVYWQDDVWPGFDAYGRRWMVEQYLDGVHLKTLALNGEDGKIYLYRAEGDTFTESERMRPARDRKNREIEAMEQEAMDIGRNKGNNQELWRRIREIKKEALEFCAYTESRKKELQEIMNRVEVYDSPSRMPPMRYQVTFMLLDNWWREREIYHADQITITEAASGKVIASSRRYMAFGFWLSDMGGATEKYFKIVGEKKAYEFDDKVLFEYAAVIDALELEKDILDRRAYRLYHN